VQKAAIEVKDEAGKKAAELFEAGEADVELDTGPGVWHIKGDPDKALTCSPGRLGGRRRAYRGQRAVHRRPADVPVRHARSVVEVDTETGKVTLLRHVTADDAGTGAQPAPAEGQRHGGIAQGAAQALVEEVLYDEDGNPLTATLADYARSPRPSCPASSCSPARRRPR
jgi:carbon-monoxide dehydrogenase large subunit